MFSNSSYGPLTHHIKHKLTEIDKFINSVISSCDNDTLILAFGDHGMTITGDHGGDSPDETDAALFAYSPKVCQFLLFAAKMTQYFFI